MPRPTTTRAALLLVLVTVLPTAVAAAPTAFPPGQYELTWQTVMPHLDEMRQQSSTATRCLDGTPDALFPVLAQPALRGCALQPVAEAPAGRWRLACQSERVATGSARIESRATQMRGDLAIKMGGKNMTFTQHTEAVRRGNCSDGR
ncbi:MAG: hypothetical protein KDK06_02605 [Gammaproteobacteria bacterium]|nr:hypothetical protein [Gammaproteobacteria bacterium]